MSTDKVPNLGLVETVDTEKVSAVKLLLVFRAPCITPAVTMLKRCASAALLILQKLSNVAMKPYFSYMQLANKLNNAVEQLGRPPLPVFVQVNTSGEQTKYGVEPSECTKLAQHIRQSCGHLRFAGLMTIGQPDYSSRPENFEVLLCPLMKAH